MSTNTRSTANQDVEAPKAKEQENQSLVDALSELSQVEADSNYKGSDFKSRNLSHASEEISKLDDKVTSGQEIAESTYGVGSGIAYYIDEFLETGRIDEIREHRRMNQQDTKHLQTGHAQPPPRGKSFEAVNSENQPLIDVLHELAEAEADSNVDNAGFRGRALRQAAQNLAQLEEKITDGQELAEGPKKVSGVGRGTAGYIDEFLETGQIKEIEDFKKKKKSGTPQKRKEPQGKVESEDEDQDGKKTRGRKKAKKPTSEESAGSTGTISINRAPVLTLWVTVVAERLGYSHEEALTYGKFVSTALAQAKGKSLGIFQKQDKREGAVAEPPKKPKKERKGVKRVYVLHDMPINVEEVDGKLLALELGQETPVEPSKVQDYLERSFGTNDLKDATDAFKKLANNLSPDDLQDKAYELYEEIRPEWKGWGKPGDLDLNFVRDMAEEEL